MPFYYDFENADPSPNVPRTASNLIDLRAQLDGLPAKTSHDRLLLATWNIKMFGAASRLEESYWYIAEILSRFDLVAVQEIRADLKALHKVRDLLGEWWDFIVTDETEGSQGNNERLGFLYDTRKVRFGGVAGEVVLPPLAGGQPSAQLARSPYIAGFRAGWFRFMLTTVHILFGAGVAGNPQRVAEISAIAQFMADRATDDAAWANNFILLGDFNIFESDGPAMTAITDAGFVIPEALQDVPQTNVGSDARHYDQIAFLFKGHPQLQPTNAGVLDFFESVYSDEKFPQYAPDVTLSGGGEPADKPRHYRTDWRRNQMSDHLLMWVELPIEFADPYLRANAG